MLTSFVTGTVIFFVGIGIANSWIINNRGEDMDLWFLSITLYTVVLFVVDIKIMFFTRFFTTFSLLSVFVFSFGIYIIYFFVADMINVFFIYRTAIAVISSPVFYLTCLLMIGTSIVIDMAFLIY